MSRRIRALLVDDEPLARERLRLALVAEPDVDIVGEAEDGPAAVEAIRALAPDVVLLDISMPGMDGFEVVREVGAEAMPAVVFVTAYDQFAVRAFEVNAVDYVLKPIDADRLRQAFRRAAQRTASDGDQVRALLSLLRERGGPQYIDRVAAQDGARMELVWLRQVEWIEAAGNYCVLHVAGQAKRVRTTMAALEAQLDPQLFVRIHRSTMVNVRAIQDIEPLHQGDYLVRLRDGRRLTSTRTYRRALLSAFGRAAE